MTFTPDPSQFHFSLRTAVYFIILQNNKQQFKIFTQGDKFDRQQKEEKSIKRSTIILPFLISFNRLLVDPNNFLSDFRSQKSVTYLPFRTS